MKSLILVFHFLQDLLKTTHQCGVGKYTFNLINLGAITVDHIYFLNLVVLWVEVLFYAIDTSACANNEHYILRLCRGIWQAYLKVAIQNESTICD